MSLTIKHLNSDCTFLLDFAPSFTSTPNNTHRPHGAFTILIDPWLSGRSSILHPTFQYTQHIDAPQITTLADLDQPLDLIVISQDKPDHCHRETLCSLPREKHVNILATPAAAKKIKSWNFFDDQRVHSIPPYDPSNPDSLIRIPLPPYTSSSQPGEITLAHLPTKYDLTRTHNGLAITYRPPGTIFSTQDGNSTASPTVANPTEKAEQKDQPPLSLLYTPHGIPPSTLQPYLTHHLLSRSLTALLHPFTTATNPFLLGGQILSGAPGGVELLKTLQGRVQVWIGAHDGKVERGGWSTWWLREGCWGVEEVDEMVRREVEGWEGRVVVLGVGEAWRGG